MAELKKIRLVSASGAQRIEGEVVLETSMDWQVAVDGKVRAYSKKEFHEVPAYEGLGSNPFGGGSANDIFGGLFGGGRR